ncbi:MAG: amidohydrolase family protein [Gemmatimonadota bacterium]
MTLFGCHAANERIPGDVTITHVNVVDVIGGRVQRDRTVTISGNRIIAVDSGRAGTGRQVAGDGMFLIPGLWDMHVHINDAADWFFPLFLANGVTGVRDMGGSLENLAHWREMRREGSLMPRVIASGPILTGAVEENDPRVIKVLTVAQADAVVDSLAGLGVDFIKVHDWLSAPVYFAILARARRRHLRVAGHLPVAIDAAQAADSGQASIEHLGNGWASLLLESNENGPAIKQRLRSLIGKRFAIADLPVAWTTDQLARYLDGYSEVKSQALAVYLARDSVWQTPTLSSLGLWLSIRDSSRLRDVRMRYLPPEERVMIGELLNAYGSSRPTTHTQAINSRYYAEQAGLVRIFSRAGVPLLAGTDVADYPLLFPGFSLHDELFWLVDAGVSPLAALQAATLGPARYFHASDSMGSIEPGKLADLVLLGGNPLDDIRNIDHVVAVIVNGQVIDQSERLRMLGSVLQRNADSALLGGNADHIDRP